MYLMETKMLVQSMTSSFLKLLTKFHMNAFFLIDIHRIKCRQTLPADADAGPGPGAVMPSLQLSNSTPAELQPSHNSCHKTYVQSAYQTWQPSIPLTL